MPQFPLQLLFYIDAASVRAGTYRETIGRYHAQLLSVTHLPVATPVSHTHVWSDLPRPLAYVRLTDAEKPLLPDVLDWLLDHDVEPIVEDGSQLRGRSDLLALLERPELQRPDNPFILFVKGERRIETTPGGPNLRHVLHGALSTLHATPAIVSVGFAPGGQQINETFCIALVPSYPAVFRTRDLYLAALLSHGQPAPFMGEADSPAFNVLNAFSHHPYRHLAFNRGIAAAA